MWVVVQSVAIRRNSWGIKIWIVRGLTLDLVGWLKDWQAGLRGRWVNGLSAPCLGCDAGLLSWSLLCLAWPQLGVELMTFCWGRWVCLRAVEMLHVTACRQSSQMCWEVMSVCLFLFQLACRLLVGRSISPLSCTEGHHIRLVRALLSAGAPSMHI